jgi:hypothetical protein
MNIQKSLLETPKPKQTGIMFGKIDFGETPKSKKGPTDAASLLKIVAKI